MYPYRPQHLLRRDSSGAGDVINDNNVRQRGQGRGFQLSDTSLLSFARFELSHHLRHVDVKRAESMECLIALLHDRVNARVYRRYLKRIFIDLGGDSIRGGGGVQVA